MQGGKTGSYLKAALDLLHDPESTIDNVVIIGGYSDTALTSQLKRDVEDAIKHYSSDVLNTYLMMKESISVYTGTNIKHLPILKNNTLVIHDESHHASSKTNLPFKTFYKKHKIDKALFGDFSQLKKRNIRVMSVGATSFAEHICNAKVELGECFEDGRDSILIGELKHTILGDVGENYYGIADYLRDGRIIFENDSDKILSQIENKECYVISRTHTFKTDLTSLSIKHNMDYKCITGGMGEEPFDFLETKPPKMTLVHICGTARMGQVLCKTHINCIIETTKMPNIDTVLQALPGRMCGYNIPPNIKIYVPSNTKDGIEKYSEDELCSIDRAMNVTKQKTASKHTIGDDVKDKSGQWWKRTVPIKIPFDLLLSVRDNDEKWKWEETTEQQILPALEAHPELIATNPDKETIGRMMKNLRISGFRKSDGVSYKGFKEKFENASKNGVRECCNFTNLITDNYTEQLIKKGSFGLFGNKDVVYLYGYIKTDTPSKEVKLPSIKPKSNYFPSIQEDGETIDANGGQIISFPSETSTNIRLFLVELVLAITRTIKTHRNYIPNCNSKISSIYDCGTNQHQGIFLDRTIFNKIEETFDTLNKDYSIKITLNKKKLFTPYINKEFPKEKWFRYTSISWEHAK
jgi:hypothetical protein